MCGGWRVIDANGRTILAHGHENQAVSEKCVDLITSCDQLYRRYNPASYVSIYGCSLEDNNNIETYMVLLSNSLLSKDPLLTINYIS